MANFIKPCDGRITSDFGWRVHPIHKKKSYHQGIDLALAGSVPIRAAADGVISENRVLGSYGCVVMIVHRINGKTYETNYAHLRSGSKVIVGQRVKQGDIIGYMGNTGSSTAQHLHFELHDGRWESGQPNAVDPELYVSFPEVRDFQSQLVKMGYKIVVDGINGPATKGAVKDFQRKFGLEIDGIVGKATKAVLIKELITLSKPLPKPIVTVVNPEKRIEETPKNGDDELFNASTATLKNAVIDEIIEAEKAGLLSGREDGSWSDYIKAGKATNGDIIGLQAVIKKREREELNK